MQIKRGRDIGSMWQHQRCLAVGRIDGQHGNDPARSENRKIEVETLIRSINQRTYKLLDICIYLYKPYT